MELWSPGRIFNVWLATGLRGQNVLDSPLFRYKRTEDNLPPSPYCVRRAPTLFAAQKGEEAR